MIYKRNGNTSRKALVAFIKLKFTKLHLFSDSSSHAFGCDFRNITDQNLVNVVFVVRISRVATLNEKTLSIPKFELQAAETAVRIKSKLIEGPVCKPYRTDSKTVLKYIKNDNKRYQSS